jgi:hypothetical protein
MFPYEPPLIQYIDDPDIKPSTRTRIGDIRQPWIDLGSMCGVSEFSAKALFSLGMMRRYVLSANTVLSTMRFHGFISAYSLLSSGIELLGRCIHPKKKVRQDPVSESMNRLEAGLVYIRNSRLQANVIVETNHYTDAMGGYSVDDLKNLRNLTVHGACIAPATAIKGDIELLHQLRKAFYGVPEGEDEPHEGTGPIKGGIDRYFEALASGDTDLCERLATAAISPTPLRLQQGAWPLDAQVVNEMNQHIEANLAMGLFPISGRYTKTDDHFQLYP